MEIAMSTTPAASGLPVKNNGGVSFGSVSSSSVLSGVDHGAGVDRTGSVVVEGVHTAGSLLAGIFAYNNQSPVAKKLTDSLAGVLNDFLVSGAAKPDLIRSPLKIEEITTTRTATAIRNGYWNEFTGTWSTEPTTAVDSFDSDNAATLTRNNPGVLVYTLGRNIPVVANYESKTN